MSIAVESDGVEQASHSSRPMPYPEWTRVLKGRAPGSSTGPTPSTALATRRGVVLASASPLRLQRARDRHGRGACQPCGEAFAQRSRDATELHRRIAVGAACYSCHHVIPPETPKNQPGR